MPCLGGTWTEPKVWYRLTPAGDIEQEGRVEGCRVETRDTRRRLCHGCPAFRGRDREGVVQNGIAPSGEPYALSAQEYERWQDDPEAFWSWFDGGARWGWQTVEGGEVRNRYMQRYMQEYRRTSETYRTKERENAKLRMRRLRERKRYAKVLSQAADGEVR